MLLDRTALAQQLRRTIKANPVTALIGPRQCGKTTLAKQITADTRAEYFDLEDPVSQVRLSQPMTALRPLRGLVVIDEVQRQPELFPVLRVLADRRPIRARFLVLGSASPELLSQSSESLAGRIAFVETGGFDLTEVGETALHKLWWRGGFPRAYLAKNDEESRTWQENFIRTFLERDIREFGVLTPAAVLRRMWMMLAHYHAQIWNASEISRSLGESHPTVKRHLDVLTGAFVVRQIQPWYENLGKRQVKSPKVYLRDSGLVHALLGIPSSRALEGHPKLGASWEGFVVEEILRAVGERNAYFWATQSGAELDLLLMLRGKRYGVEIKYGDAPSSTKSMRIALQDLSLEKLFVVYPGEEGYQLDDKIEVIPLARMRSKLFGREMRRSSRRADRLGPAPRAE